MRTTLLGRLTAAALLVVSAAIPAAAQTDSTQHAQLRVFLDCQTGGCDFDFFRTELPSLDWVRDRQVADVHVLVTAQQTGAGGSEYTVAFLGLRELRGVGDTLRRAVAPASAQDEVRRALLQVLRVGLVPFVARVSGYDMVQVTLGNASATASPAAPPRDRWNYWVFEISSDGFTEGQQRSSQFNNWSQVEANRITVHWKTEIELGSQYSEQRFTVDTAPTGSPAPMYTTETYIQRGAAFDVLQVRSLTPHLSAGGRASVGSSTYSNMHRQTQVMAAVEYNLFPYSESTRRQLRVQYAVGGSWLAFEDTTIYLKTRQTLAQHYVRVGYEARQPWGGANVSVERNGYLSWGSKHALTVSGNMNLRVVRGLRVEVGGRYSKINDQISLAKGDESIGDVLLRQRQLATSYRYWANFGLSYTFGSIHNNVVNPRFRNSIGNFDN